MPQQNYRKRRPHAGPNKNDLKVSQNEAEQRNRAAAGTLRERFPRVRELHVETRMEAATGAILDQSNRTVGLDQAILLDVPCQGGCSGGVFMLTEVIQTVLTSGQETRDGMGICQASSYRDPSLPCGIKFYYRVTVNY